MKKLLVLLIIFNCQFFIVNCNAQPLSVSASVIQNVSCHGGDNGVATCTPAGGSTPYTYLWSPGSQTTQTATGLVAATYTIKVTDYLNNTATASVAVLQPAAPLMINAWAKTSAVCPASSDSLFASVSGGSAPYSYTWTGPIGDITSPTSQNTLCYPYGGAYVVTAVVDAWGCSATSSVAITTYPVPLVSITGPLSPVSYTSDTLVAISPGASSYLWSNSATTSTIIVSPSGITTYSVKTTNSYGCYDTAHYTISANTGNGNSSGTAIPVSLSANVTTTSYSSLDSAVWFSFIPYTDSNAQIIAYSNWLSEPVPHVHRLTLYNSSMQTVMDEPMPDIVGANEIRLDISHLTIGNTYYVRASRCPAHANMAGCNPSASGECNPTMRWDFQMCFRTVPVFVPDDSGAEPFDVSQLYYEHRGQITDLNKIPRFDVKAYTNNTRPEVYCTDSAVSFVYQHIDTGKSFKDTFQRVDMILTGASVQPSEPVFKMQEDSNAGYLNYFLGFVPNGVPKVEGYARMVYNNVYPNVSMQVFSNNAGTKFYFICAPAGGGLGAGNPANIELQFKGASSVNVTGNGGLNVVTELGTLSFAPGYAYEDSAGTIVPTSWQPYFIAVNSNTVRFNTGSYNTNEPLIIRIDRGHRANPSYSAIQGLNWSTYVGGTDWQSVFNDVCSDDTGNVYATGYTQSLYYPVTAKAFQGNLYQYNVDYLNATITKFSNANAHDSIIWSTYYGGSITTSSYGIGLDASGNVYIAGATDSPNLPMAVITPSSPNNYTQVMLNNNINDNQNSDAFIAMFSNNGEDLYWATFYGGTDASEYAYHLAIDKDTNIYVVGGGVNAAVNTTFPLYASTKPGAYNDSTYGTGFALEFNATHAFDNNIGITLKWATRLGDTNHSTNNHTKSSAYLYGCTVDASNNFYVTGVASGYGYTSPATLKFSYKGDASANGENAVVTRFNSNNNIVWSSYFGGNADDIGYAITVDKSGDTYITGSATSDSIATGVGIETKPLNSGFFQEYNQNGGGPNAFIAEFDSTGNQLWGTYFGGSDNLVGYAIKVDKFYDLYLTGYDYGTNMPLPWMNPYGVYSQRSYVSGQTSANSFIADFATAPVDPDYTWGTYFGNDAGTGLTLTHVGSDYWLYMVGSEGNGNTPLVDPPGSYFDSTYYFSSQDTTDLGTSFISLFNVDPIVGSAGVSAINNPASEMLVYPNPTTQDVTMQLYLPGAEQVQLSLFNLLGEVVFTENVGGQQGIFQKQISLSSLPATTYILQAETKDKVYYNKITKLQ